MLWLYILLGIVLFFAIIFAIPIEVCVQYKKQFFCRLRIGFVKIILKRVGTFGDCKSFYKDYRACRRCIKRFFCTHNNQKLCAKHKSRRKRRCRYGYKLRQGLLGCLSADKCGYKFNEIYALRCGYSSRLYGGCGNQD